MARLKTGEVVMTTNDALSAKDLEKGFILTCQSRPTTSEIEIDYDDF